LIGVFVVASLAVAAASGRLGGDDFEMDSAEPTTSGQSTGDGSAGEPQPGPAVVDPPAGGSDDPDEAEPAAKPGPTHGPDTPVASDGTPAPNPTAVADPPSAFSGIRTFEQCAAAGYPVMESYPEQCRTPDGRLFVRVIEQG
jgi:hypothetical protein